jgi:hypothetical protein
MGNIKLLQEEHWILIKACKGTNLEHCFKVNKRKQNFELKNVTDSITMGYINYGNLPLRTCPGCGVPEPYRSPDWVLVPAKPA